MSAVCVETHRQSWNPHWASQSRFTNVSLAKRRAEKHKGHCSAAVSCERDECANCQFKLLSPAPPLGLWCRAIQQHHGLPARHSKGIHLRSLSLQRGWGVCNLGPRNFLLTFMPSGPVVPGRPMSPFSP